MNILKLLKEHNDNVISINNNIDNLLLKETWYDPTTWFDKDKSKSDNSSDTKSNDVDSAESQPDNDNDVHLNSAIDSIKNLLSTADQLSDAKIDTDISQKIYKSIKIKLIDDIIFKEPHENEKIEKNDNVEFIISKVIDNNNNKTIIQLDGDKNKLIPNDIKLKITIPHPDGLNYTNNFTAKVEQFNVNNNKTTDLNNVKILILSKK